MLSAFLRGFLLLCAILCQGASYEARCGQVAWWQVLVWWPASPCRGRVLLGTRCFCGWKLHGQSKFMQRAAKALSESRDCRSVAQPLLLQGPPALGLLGSASGCLPLWAGDGHGHELGRIWKSCCGFGEAVALSGLPPAARHSSHPSGVARSFVPCAGSARMVLVMNFLPSHPLKLAGKGVACS